MKRFIHNTVALIASCLFTTVAFADNVAKIGTTEYETLAGAVAAATAGQTVTLLADVTLTQRVEPNKDMTIDLNSKTITTTATCGNGSAFDVKSGNVTIQNGTINASFGEANSGETDAITARSGSNVTLKGLNITVNSRNGSCAYAFEGGHITIESGVYKNLTTETYQWNSNFKALVVNQANVAAQLLTINGGTFVGQDPSAGDDSGKTNTFLPSTLATQKDASGNFVVVEAVAKIGNKGYATLKEAVDAVPTDGTETTIEILKDIDLGTTVVAIPSTKNIVLDLDDKTITSANTSNGTLRVAGKLTINGTGIIESTNKYAIQTTAAAADVVLNGGTLKTIANSNGAVYGTYGKFTMNGGAIVAEGDGINCKSADIKGGTITAKGDAIYASGTYNITGGTISGGAGKHAVNINSGSVYVSAGATLNTKIGFTAAATGLILPGTDATHIDNSTANLEIYDGETLLGTTTANTTSSIGTSGQSVKLVSDITPSNPVRLRASKFDLNGHDITSTATAAIVVEGRNASNFCNLVITGEGNVSSTAASGCNAIQIGNYADITIEGGNYSVPDDNSTIYIASGIASYPTVVNITGGTFESGDGKYVLNCKDDVYAKNGATFVVTGGTFKEFDPSDCISEGAHTNFVASGYHAAKNPDGTYTVGKSVARIGDDKYLTIEEALEAAGTEEEKTITLLADVTIEKNIDVSANVTIDPNEKILTFNMFIVKDGVRFRMPATSCHANIATYTRENLAGLEWGTVCLPYALQSTQDDYTLYNINNISESTLTVDEVEIGIPAGTPIIFQKTDKAAASVTITATDVDITDAEPVAANQLFGTYDKQVKTTGLENIYYINSDAFHKAMVSLTIPTYRAYIDTTVANPAKTLMIRVSNAVSGIDAAEYSTPASAVKKYLNNGNLVIESAGRTYTVTGALVK